jgi:hypothetical protein
MVLHKVRRTFDGKYIWGGKFVLDYCGARTPHTNFFRNPINIATFHTKSTMRTRAITMVKRKYQDGDYIAACVLSEISGNSNRKTARLTGLSH